MITLRIELRSRKEPIDINCDSYKTEDYNEDTVAGRWLTLYEGEKVLGRYRLSEVVGYHEIPEASVTFM